MNATPTLSRLLADELAAPTSIRRIVLADGTVYNHEVGPLSHIDTYRYQTKLTTTETEQTA